MSLKNNLVKWRTSESALPFKCLRQIKSPGINSFLSRSTRAGNLRASNRVGGARTGTGVRMGAGDPGVRMPDAGMQAGTGASTGAGARDYWPAGRECRPGARSGASARRGQDRGGGKVRGGQVGPGSHGNRAGLPWVPDH